METFVRISLKSALVLGLTALSFPAFGAIKGLSVDGASNFDDEEATVVIYGGTGGAVTAGNCSSSVTTTCNNCEASLVGCNTKRITPSTELRISFQSDSVEGSAGEAIIVRSSDDQVLTNFSATPASGIGKDQTVTIEIEWGDLCSQLGSDVNCSTNLNSSNTVEIGIDADDNGSLDDSGDDKFSANIVVHDPAIVNGTWDTTDFCGGTNTAGGICDFLAFPGDEKVVLENLRDDDNGFPTFDGQEIIALRLYYSKNGFGDVTYASDNKRFEIEEDSEGFTTKESILSGLDNNVTYYFRIATEDLAGNIGHITSDQGVIDGCALGSLPASDDASTDLNCPYMAHPSPVSGLLTEDVNCFVATAANGSSQHPMVQDLRRFRGQILLKTSLGRWLNRQYYRWGPYLARAIVDSEPLKVISRIGLWPAWAFAVLSLKIGGLQAILVILSGLGLFLGAGIALVRHAKGSAA